MSSVSALQTALEENTNLRGKKQAWFSVLCHFELYKYYRCLWNKSVIIIIIIIIININIIIIIITINIVVVVFFAKIGLV